MKIIFDLDKNGYYRLSCSGGKWIVVVRQKGRQNLSSLGFFKIHQFQFYSTFWLFECIYHVTNFVPIDLWLVFGANAIDVNGCLLQLHFGEAILFLVDLYY